MRRIILSVAAGLALSSAGPAAAQDAHDRPAVQLAPGGLALVDPESGERSIVGFGTGQDETVEALTAALGSPEGSDLNEECDAGPLHHVDFQGGLRLFFQAGEFAGWSTEGGWPGAGGIRVGMSYGELTRASEEVEAEESSLGAEFSADGYHGLLTEMGDGGSVSTLWAGTICAMR